MFSQHQGEDISISILPFTDLPSVFYHILNFARLSVSSFSFVAITQSFCFLLKLTLDIENQ